MDKSNLRLKKLVKLRKILFNKRISHLSKTLTAVVLAVVSPTVASNKQGGNFNYLGDRKIDHKEWISYATIKQNSMPEINWEKEINQRTDWLMQEYVDTLKSSLNEIMGIKQYRDRRDYISKNFFDKVYSAGHLRMANFYCVAGAMSCLSRVNDETGDLDSFFPDATSAEANAMVSCPGFAAYVKKNYKYGLKMYHCLTRNFMICSI